MDTHNRDQSRNSATQSGSIKAREVRAPTWTLPTNSLAWAAPKDKAQVQAGDSPQMARGNQDASTQIPLPEGTTVSPRVRNTAIQKTSMSSPHMLSPWSVLRGHKAIGVPVRRFIFPWKWRSGHMWHTWSHRRLPRVVHAWLSPCTVFRQHQEVGVPARRFLFPWTWQSVLSRHTRSHQSLPWPVCTWLSPWTKGFDGQ